MENLHLYQVPVYSYEPINWGKGKSSNLWSERKDSEVREFVRKSEDCTCKYGKPIENQITEAVRISNKSEAENINSKNKFNHQNVQRLRLANLHCYVEVCNLCVCVQVRVSVGICVLRYKPC